MPGSPRRRHRRRDVNLKQRRKCPSAHFVCVQRFSLLFFHSRWHLSGARCTRKRTDTNVFATYTQNQQLHEGDSLQS